MNDIHQPELPRWMRELERLSAYKSQIYLYGNIKDTVLFPLPRPVVLDPLAAPAQGESSPVAAAGQPWKLGSMRESLFENFKARGYNLIGAYNPVDGMTFADAPAAGLPIPVPGAGAPPTPKPGEGPAGVTMAQLYEEMIVAGEQSAHAGVKGGGRHPRATVPTAAVEIAFQHMRICLMNPKVPTVFIVENGTQLLSSPQRLDCSERAAFLRLLRTGEESRVVASRRGEGNEGRELQNLLLVMCEKLTDLPPWFYINNPYGAGVEVERPRSYERRHFFTRFLPNLNEVSHASTGKSPLEELVDLTDDMTVRDLYGVRKLAREELRRTRELKPKSIVDRFKYGEKESEWDTLDPSRLLNAEETLSRRVMGQPAAVSAVADVLRRARLGLSGAQHSSKTKPRGVLFFAGPTGVGKTELAKAIAELVFGTQEACIRFDMSEYGQPNSDQRLLGAPPGYVGYEEGGQLSNAVRANPFSVLLFDEIEKAHPIVLDKFLQILEDGRMTDGRGNTVYFAESIIVFTSNVGIYKLDSVTGRPRVDPLTGKPDLHVNPELDTEYGDVRQKVLSGVEAYFKHFLGRPELLNRIGQNVIVFDFVRSATLRNILEKKVLPSIARQVTETHGLQVTFGPQVVQRLMEWGGDDVSSGGRGMGNLAEMAVVNPLSRALFAMLASNERASMIVDDIARPEGEEARYELVWHRAPIEAKQGPASAAEETLARAPEGEAA